jgi:hypothetical protein
MPHTVTFRCPHAGGVVFLQIWCYSVRSNHTVALCGAIRRKQQNAMPFIPVTNVAAVHIRGILDGQMTENVLYYKFPTQPDAGDLQALVDAIALQITADWFPLLPAEWTAREVYAEDLTEKPGAQAVNTTVAGDTGLYTTPVLPNNVTFALQRSSGMTGRSARGRIYWQGLAEETTVGNTVTTAFANAVVEAIEGTDAAAAALTWIPVIVSLYENLLPRSAGVTFDILNWKWVDRTIDSMRRRLPGRGS